MIGMYRKRQEKLIRSLPDNSVLIIPGACLRLRSQDTHFPFRKIVIFTIYQDSIFRFYTDDSQR